MLHEYRNILENSDYYIKYNFMAERKAATLTVSWLPKPYVVKYDSEAQELITNLLDKTIPCVSYAAPALVYLLVRKICDLHNYPYEFVFFNVENNPTHGFFFDVLKDEEENTYSMDVFYLVESILSDGLQPEHIEAAKTFDTYSGLCDILEHYFDIKLERSSEAD